MALSVIVNQYSVNVPNVEGDFWIDEDPNVFLKSAYTSNDFVLNIEFDVYDTVLDIYYTVNSVSGHLVNSSFTNVTFTTINNNTIQVSGVLSHVSNSDLIFPNERFVYIQNNPPVFTQTTIKTNESVNNYLTVIAWNPPHVGNFSNGKFWHVFSDIYKFNIIYLYANSSLGNTNHTMSQYLYWNKGGSETLFANLISTSLV